MPYRELEISIYPCSVANPADCQPESAFEDMGLWYSSAGRTIDFTNKNDPIGLQPGTDVRYQFDVRGTQVMVTSLAENEIYDSNWDFLEPSLRTRYSSVASKDIYKMNRGTIPRHCPASELQKYRPNCIPYFTFTYHPSSEKNVYVREYKTILTTLSDIGGIYDIIILFIGSLYCWYN